MLASVSPPDTSLGTVIPRRDRTPGLPHAPEQAILYDILTSGTNYVIHQGSDRCPPVPQPCTPLLYTPPVFTNFDSSPALD